MKEFKWSDITIKQFKQLEEIDISNIEDLDTSIKILSIITGNSEEYYLSIPINKLCEELSLIKFLEKEPEKADVKTTYIVNNKKYILTINMSKLTTAQYIDYTTVLSNDYNNVSLLMAILLVPDGHKYNEGYDVLELSKEFEEHFKIVDVSSITFFLSTLLKVLTKVTLDYSIKKLKKKLKKEKNPYNKIHLEMSIQALKENMLGK